jgi:hypothetical protein
MEIQGKVQEITNIAKKLNPGEMNQIDHIRDIQRAEGNNACFATSAVQT